MPQTTAQTKINEIIRTMREDIKAFEIKLETVREINSTDPPELILAWKGVQISVLNKVYILNACDEWIELKPDLKFAEIIADHLQAFLQETIKELDQH